MTPSNFTQRESVERDWQVRGLWMCVCGWINGRDWKRCENCERDKNDVE